ncbi:MAG: peptidylprolyl isomerase [Terriglobia bacterium]
MKFISKTLGGLLFLICANQFLLRADQVFEQIIVWVNNDIITLSDFERNKELLRKELQKGLKGPEFDRVYALQEKEILKSMIDDQLLVQKATELGLTADTEVIKYLDRIRRDFNVDSMEDLEKMMIQQGVDPIEFKQNAKTQALKQMVLAREVYSHIQITTEEISKYYEAHKQDFDRPEEVRIREILITTEGKKEVDLAALQKRAQEVLQKAKTGDKFEELAAKYSDGPTGKEGGDLGFFPKGKMVKEIEEVAFSLRRGQVSDIIKTKYGLVIIKVEEKHEAGIQKMEVVQNEIRDRLFGDKAQPAIQAYLIKLRQKSYIQVRSGFVDSGAVPSLLQAELQSEDSGEKGKKGKSK